jgi:hypothetical protein
MNGAVCYPAGELEISSRSESNQSAETITWGNQLPVQQPWQGIGRAATICRRRRTPGWGSALKT